MKKQETSLKLGLNKQTVADLPGEWMGKVVGGTEKLPQETVTTTTEYTNNTHWLWNC